MKTKIKWISFIIMVLIFSWYIGLSYYYLPLPDNPSLLQQIESFLKSPFHIPFNILPLWINIILVTFSFICFLTHIIITVNEALNHEA